MNIYVPHPFRKPWTISGHFTFPNIFPCGYCSHKQTARDFVPEKFQTTIVYLTFIFYLNASVFTQPCLVAVESWSGDHWSLPWALLADHDSVSTRNQISETKTGTAFRGASASYDIWTATVPNDHQLPLLWALRMNADQLLLSYSSHTPLGWGWTNGKTKQCSHSLSKEETLSQKDQHFTLQKTWTYSFAYTVEKLHRHNLH